MFSSFIRFFIFAAIQGHVKMSVCKHFGRLCSAFTSLYISPAARTGLENGNRISMVCGTTISSDKKFHTCSTQHGLMEFFDSVENWSAKRVKVGRAWKLDELRIKSNSDLHKLWFVLLKEKNMLLTMEHEYKENYVAMPSPERIHKVNESMDNLEKVVRERNRAYYELETGETGERKIVKDHDGFGLPYRRKLREHFIEKKFNEPYKRFLRRRHNMVVDPDVIWFLKRYKEKQRKMEFMRNKTKYKHVCGLLKRFEGIDEEAIKDQYPEVDLEQAKMDKLSRGPRENFH